MDEEVQDMRPMMRSLALGAMGDFLLLIGVVFILWGVSDFIGDFLKVKGSGYMLVGLALFFLALIMLLRSRMSLPKMQQPMKEKKIRSEDYR